METRLDPVDPVAQRRMLESRSVWHYLPWAFLYPWRGLAWLSLALLACGMWLMSISAGSVVYTLGFLGATLQYFFTVLGRTIDGRATPPGLTEVMSADAESGRFQLLCALAVACGVALGQTAHPSLERSWFVFCVLALPACAVTLALGADIAQACDPRRWWAIMSAAGGWYLVLAGAVGVALWAGGSRFGLFRAESLPAPGQTVRLLDTSGLIWTLVAVQLAVVWAHLLGLVVHRQHDALDLLVSRRAPRPEELERAALEREVARVLPEAWRRWDAGDHDGAERLLITVPLRRGQEHPHLEHLFDAVRTRRGHARLVCALGRRLIAELLRHQRRARALEVAIDCLDRAGNFTAGHLDQQMQLIAEAWRVGQPAVAERLSANARAERPEAAARIAALVPGGRDASGD